jgi:preprotein translocase subunit SecY
MVNVFGGGAVERMAIFALNIIPYISASIIMQLMTAVSPKLEALKKEGEQGRKQINQYTRYLTVLLSAVQAFAIARGLLGASSPVGGADAVIIDPVVFQISTVITLVGGTIFLMWLGEQITSRGVGNGISLIIFAGIIAEIPRALAGTLQLGAEGAISGYVIVFLILLAIAVIGFVVFMERAQRRILIQYPKRQMGNRMFGGESSHLPLKLNVSGVIPAIFASSLLFLPLTAAQFSGTGGGPEWLTTLTTLVGRGQPLYYVLYGGLIIFFAFFYTSIMFNPDDMADNLKKHGGFVPGIRPGKRTSEYLDYVLTRLTVVGSLYLALVVLIPDAIITELGLPFFALGGTSLLIVVTVTMDTVAQIQSHLLAHQYEGLIKKSKLRGARR